MAAEAERRGSTTIAEEDRARAGCYALIGRLFYGPPDSHFLAEICGAGAGNGESGTNGALGQAWRQLQEAGRSAFPAVVRQEYDTLFIGVGKALVTPYTSRYASEHAPDKHLVALREQLEAWGLARRERTFEVEDHVSGMCDVMRCLIEEETPLAEQRQFFEVFVYPGLMPFLDAVDAAEAAVFYRHAALFARRFIELEQAAFEMLD